MAGSQDIRERDQRAAEQREDRFELVSWATQDAIFDWDLVVHEIWRNENYQRLFGAPETSPESDNWWLDRVHPEDLERVVALRNAALRSEDEPFLAGYRLRCPDGSYAEIAERSLIVRDAKGQAVRMIGALTDITRRKRAEEALAESEARFRTLVENSTVGIYRTTPDGRILMANPALVRILGYDSFEELASRNLNSEGFAPGYPRSVFQEQVERGGEIKGLESAWKRHDGTVIFVRESARVVRAGDGRVLHYDGIIEDVTERKQAEEALRETEARFRAVFENAAIGIALVDVHGHPLESNPALQRMLGCSADELAGASFAEYAHPADLRASWHMFEDLVEGKLDHYQLDKRFCRKDGTVTWGQVSVSLVRDQHGLPLYAVGMLEDITERKQAEEALRVSEARFRALSDRAPAAIFVYQENRYLYANPAFEVITGYSQDEILKMNLWDVAHPDSRESVRERGLARERGKDVPLHYEVRILTKAGEERWLNFTDGEFVLDGKLAVVGIAFDITDRKREEARLCDLVSQLQALAKRLQTVREGERGKVAQELHDELGQALTAIKFDLGLILRKLRDKAEPLAGATEAVLGKIDQTIGTVRRITGQLRPLILDALGLPAAIEWATEEFQTRTGIKCDLKMAEEEIVLDRERSTALFRIFQEALTNVALHSRATELWVRLYRQTATTILEVRDNGVGIQPHQLTGTTSLGILGMRERALVLGGQVEVTGRPGEGTNVSVSIPDPLPAVGE